MANEVAHVVTRLAAACNSGGCCGGDRVRCEHAALPRVWHWQASEYGRLRHEVAWLVERAGCGGMGP